MKKISKSGTEKQVSIFFDNIKNKLPEDIKKIKKLAMNQNVKLKENKKKFCKYCFSPYSEQEKIRIKKGVKSITCKKCEKINRWKMRSIDKS